MGAVHTSGTVYLYISPHYVTTHKTNIGFFNDGRNSHLTPDDESNMFLRKCDIYPQVYTALVSRPASINLSWPPLKAQLCKPLNLNHPPAVIRNHARYSGSLMAIKTLRNAGASNTCSARLVCAHREHCKCLLHCAVFSKQLYR
jgi:hypothetical protein